MIEHVCLDVKLSMPKKHEKVRMTQDESNDITKLYKIAALQK